MMLSAFEDDKSVSDVICMLSLQAEWSLHPSLSFTLFSSGLSHKTTNLLNTSILSFS